MKQTEQKEPTLAAIYASYSFTREEIELLHYLVAEIQLLPGGENSLRRDPKYRFTISELVTLPKLLAKLQRARRL